ncbi:hypothetical protein BN1723_019308, partial [Verticillium longisporum]
PDTALTMEL